MTDWRDEEYDELGWDEDAIRAALEERYGGWDCFDVDEAYDELESLLDGPPADEPDVPRISTEDEGPVHRLYDPDSGAFFMYTEEDPARLPGRVYDGGTDTMESETSRGRVREGTQRR